MDAAPAAAAGRLIRLRLARKQVLAAAVRIEQFDPSADEARLRACYQMVAGAHQEDDPNAPVESYGAFRGYWVHGMLGVQRQTWLATSDSGMPIGCYVLELPELENTGIAFGYPIVAMTSRRLGIGTRLVAHAADQADQEGRTILSTRLGPGSPRRSALGRPCAPLAGS